MPRSQQDRRRRERDEQVAGLEDVPALWWAMVAACWAAAFALREPRPAAGFFFLVSGMASLFAGALSGARRRLREKRERAVASMMMRGDHRGPSSSENE